MHTFLQNPKAYFARPEMVLPLPQAIAAFESEASRNWASAQMTASFAAKWAVRFGDIAGNDPSICRLRGEFSP